jgi:hypothetical protein
MLASLPFLCYICIAFLIKNNEIFCWRKSILFASLIWGTILTAITELLSLFKILTFEYVLGIWAGILLLLIVWLFFKYRNNFNLRQFFPSIKISPSDFVLLFCLGIVLIILGCVAWISPPNNWDSMTYHMSRVMHWIQNKSVAFYPTHSLRQLYQYPWAEYAILHFQLLSGGDRFANFVQYFSMIGSAIGVSLIAKELKANPRGQLLAAIISVTIPMGILQSTSTQNDYVVTYWIICLVNLVFLFKQKTCWYHTVGLGLALGLSILTKPTACIFAFPFMAWLGLSLLFSRNWKAVGHIAIVVVLAITLISGHFIRSSKLFGSPLNSGGSSFGVGYSNEIFNAPALASNIIRNFSLHMATPDPRFNKALDNLIYSFHRHIGISASDPQTTFPDTEYHVPQINYNEDLSGNSVHFYLLCICVIIYLFRCPKEPEGNLYLLLMISGFLLFSIVLKWQLWHSRLQLPLFVISSAWIGYVISQVRPKWVINPLGFCMIFLCLPWILNNPAKPLSRLDSYLDTKRTEKYFYMMPSIKGYYINAAHYLASINCSNIGLITYEDGWEYPLWALLDNQSDAKFRIEPVNVTNISQSLAKSETNMTKDADFCAVFVIAQNSPHDILVENTNYQMRWNSSTISIYLPETTP